jgi:hypothetical protein
MINILLQRLSRPPFATAIAARVAVCPPSSFHDSDLDGLAQVKQEFSQQLADLPAESTGLLLQRIEKARSMLELWHLRPGVFGLVSLHHSQHEAAARLARLNRHFPASSPASSPARSPRSGFAPLQG